MTDRAPEAQVARILSQTVFMRDANVPFGELTADDARARADELRAAVGWGPTVRIAPVAMAWRELAMTMDAAAVPAVRDLAPDVLIRFAPRLWVVPPQGSLL